MRFSLNLCHHKKLPFPLNVCDVISEWPDLAALYFWSEMWFCVKKFASIFYSFHYMFPLFVHFYEGSNKQCVHLKQTCVTIDTYGLGKKDENIVYMLSINVPNRYQKSQNVFICF